jgi:hypothetical protein
MKRKKIFYVPGLISILGLPILLLIMGPDDPVEQTAMRLYLPSDRDSPSPSGTISFDRYWINQVLKKKKIVEVDLDYRPSVLHPEYNAYRKSSFVLSEMGRLQFTHDTSEILKINFTEETSYGEFVWALNNATVFCFKRYFYIDDALYLLPNSPPPPKIRDKLEPLYLDDYDPDVRHFLQPTRWEMFQRRVYWEWRDLEACLRYNYMFASGFLLLIIIPGLIGTVRRYRANRTSLAARS